jgi:hypothetical protein
MRITIPDGQLAILLPIQLAEELYSLCNLIRKSKRLHVEPAAHAIAGDVMLALLASEGITILSRRANDE